MANKIKIKQIDEVDLTAFINEVLDGTGTVYTANRALVTDSLGDVVVSSVTSTELGYVSGVTSAIQTQLDGKAASSHTHAASDITSGTIATARLGTGTANSSSYLRGDQTWSTISLSDYLPLAGGTMTGSITMSGTITANTPLLISHTWNNAGVAFQAIDISITNTNSSASSNLIRATVGGSQMLKLTKTGRFELGSGGASAIFDGAGNSLIGSYLWLTGADLRLYDTGSLGFSSSGLYGTPDINLFRRAAGVMAQRAGATAQTHEIYGAYTDSSNYVRCSLSCSATIVTLAAETAGTGADNIDLALTPAGTGQVISYHKNGYTIGYNSSHYCRIGKIDDNAASTHVYFGGYYDGFGTLIYRYNASTNQNLFVYGSRSSNVDDGTYPANLQFVVRGYEEARIALTLNNVGNVGIGTTSPGAQLHVTAGAAGTIGSIIKAAASQTANLTEWQTSAGALVAAVTSVGVLHTYGSYSNSGTNYDRAALSSSSTGVTLAAESAGTGATHPFISLKPKGVNGAVYVQLNDAALLQDGFMHAKDPNVTYLKSHKGGTGLFVYNQSAYGQGLLHRSVDGMGLTSHDCITQRSDHLYFTGACVGAGPYASLANLVAGQSFNGSGQYTLTGLVAGEYFSWYSQGNITSITNGTQTCTAYGSSGGFVAQGTSVVVNGTPSAAITGVIYRPAPNLLVSTNTYTQAQAGHMKSAVHLSAKCGGQNVYAPFITADMNFDARIFRFYTGGDQQQVSNVNNGNYVGGLSGVGTEVFRINELGKVGIGAGSPDAQLQVTVGAAETIGQIIKAAASQTANLTEWQNSSGTVLANVSAAGVVKATEVNIDAGAYPTRLKFRGQNILTLTDSGTVSINEAGCSIVSFPGSTLNRVGIGTSATTGSVAQFCVNGTIHSRVAETNTILDSGGTVQNTMVLVGGDAYWGIRGSTAHEFCVDTYNAGTPIAALKLAQNGTLTLAAGIVSGAAIRLKGYTVATLPAGTQGDMAFATDLLTPTFLVAAVGGGAVVGPVFYNGSEWVTF